MAVQALVRVMEPKQEYNGLTTRLRNLGFTTAIERLARAERLKIAYTKYAHVSQENVNKFNETLRRDTMNDIKRTYQTLTFTPVSQYPQIPPEEVLQKLEEAMSDDVFDGFEVAHIVSKEVIPDPILFGTIGGCSDKFVIAQWDTDVTVEDLVNA